MPDVLSAIVWQLRSLTLRARSLVLKPRSGESRRNERVLVSVGKNFPGRHCQVVASLPTSRFLSCKARTGRSTLASITNGIWRLACSKWRWLQSLDLRSAPLPPALLRSYGRSMAGIRPGVALQVDRMADAGLRTAGLRRGCLSLTTIPRVNPGSNIPPLWPRWLIQIFQRGRRVEFTQNAAFSD
jgi:hypothetical protein